MHSSALRTHSAALGSPGTAFLTARRAVHRAAGCLSEGVRLGRRHGFAAGPALDHIHSGVPRGLPGPGVLLDRAYLNGAGPRALRARYALVQRLLRREIAVRGGGLVLLDAASGPGRCLQDLVAEEQPGGQLRVHCRDPAPGELARGRRLARERGLPPDAVTFAPGDALDPAPLPGGARADLIVVAGLYELIPDDETVRRSLERLRGLLAPGGTLLFTTRALPPPAEFATSVVPARELRLWRASCRTPDEAEACAGKAGFAQDAVGSRREELGQYTVTRCGT